MRHWVQYLNWSTGYAQGSSPPRFDGPRELIDACGDRAVFVLDGRNDITTMVADARRFGRRHQWPAFQIVSGVRLFEESRRSAILHVEAT